MKNFSVSVIVLLVLVIFLVTAGCTHDLSGINPSGTNNPDSPQKEIYTSNETLVAFVDSAVAYTKTHGREKALAEFNNPNGSFIRGELYIYAYAFNGTTLAHPVNPEAVGKLRTGTNGIFVTEMAAVIRNGSGYYRFIYINPLHNNTLESKMGYGAKIDDDWWLGSGVYTGPVANQIVSGSKA
ncbi:cache domain-containing protein [Methanoregula sp.]|uniref:cache domain-containing protein n=1 Tax=Methanoregula sp. TaxID=2052170 RepID=UPI003561EC08